MEYSRERTHGYHEGRSGQAEEKSGWNKWLVAGWGEYSVMEDFGKAKLDFFKTFLELPDKIPDEKIFLRLFSRINQTELVLT
jgi:hypothetical protein